MSCDILITKSLQNPYNAFPRQPYCISLPPYLLITVCNEQVSSCRLRARWCLSNSPANPWYYRNIASSVGCGYIKTFACVAIRIGYYGGTCHCTGNGKSLTFAIWIILCITPHNSYPPTTYVQDVRLNSLWSRTRKSVAVTRTLLSFTIKATEESAVCQETELCETPVNGLQETELWLSCLSR